MKDALKKYWGHILVAITGVAALVAAITPTPKDEELGQKLSPEFKAAWERGVALQPVEAQPSPTSVE